MAEPLPRYEEAPAAETVFDLPVVPPEPHEQAFDAWQALSSPPRSEAPPEEARPEQQAPSDWYAEPQGYGRPHQQYAEHQQGYADPQQYAEPQQPYGEPGQYEQQRQYVQEQYAQEQYGQRQYGQERDYGAAYDEAAEEVRGGKKKRRRGLIFTVVVVLLLAGAVAGQLLRPLPDPTVRLTLTTTSHTFPGAAPTLPWSPQGQSALYVEGLGSMGSSGGSVPTPTASVAKVMTAYVFLKEHPLAPGAPGPTYTVSPQAAAQIPARKQRGESLLDVTAGMRLTERKALEALMIISANDVAHELARWDSGDPRSFIQKMNDTARELGMTGTTYTDPSGYLSTTVSTAADQLKLLRAAMRVPAFVEIVSKPAYVPDGPGQPRQGGNVLLGRHGVIGGKTGYTDAAGGNFVFAARKRIGGVDTRFYGAVMGQRTPNAIGAVQSAGNLVSAAQDSMTAVTLVQQGATVAQVHDGLGGRTALRAASPLTVVGWPGRTVQLTLEGTDGQVPRTASQGERLGSVKTGAANVPLLLGRDLDEPPLQKRLLRVR